MICYTSRWVLVGMSGTAKDIPPLHLWEVVVPDTETTGLPDNPFAEILEIAVVGLAGDVLLNTKVRPTRMDEALKFDEEGVRRALEINGYNEEGWRSAPTFAEVAQDVVRVFEHKVIVGQNPHFDREFIVRGLTHAGVDKAYRKLSRHVVDTTTLAWEHLVPCGLDRLNLDAICGFLGIPLDRATRHGALADAQACRQAYLTLLRASEEQRAAWKNQALA